MDARFGNRGCKSCKIKRCGLSCGFHICDIKIFELQFFRIDFHKTEAMSCKRYESVFFVLRISNLETDLQLWQKQCCGGLVAEVKALPTVEKYLLQNYNIVLILMLWRYLWAR